MKLGVKYTCPVIQIASMVLRGNFTAVPCPGPSVANSTVRQSDMARGILTVGGKWRDVTNTNTYARTQVEAGSKIMGRDAETAVPLNMPDEVVRSSTIVSITGMTKVCATMGCHRVYGMTVQSLAVFSRILLTPYNRDILALVLTERIKVTVEHVSGCSIVFTYMGTVSYTGNPSKIPIAISEFMQVVNMVFMNSGSEGSLNVSGGRVTGGGASLGEMEMQRLTGNELAMCSYELQLWGNTLSTTWCSNCPRGLAACTCGDQSTTGSIRPSKGLLDSIVTMIHASGLDVELFK